MKNKNKCSKCAWCNYERTDTLNSMGIRAFCQWGKNSEMAKNNKYAIKCHHFYLQKRYQKKEKLLEPIDFKIIAAMSGKKVKF